MQEGRSGDALARGAAGPGRERTLKVRRSWCLVVVVVVVVAFVTPSFIISLYFRGRYTYRYGTGPLRRYIDILAQRQMAAILRGSGYLNKQELIETVSVVFRV